jgi:hypothetical protein
MATLKEVCVFRILLTVSLFSTPGAAPISLAQNNQVGQTTPRIRHSGVFRDQRTEQPQRQFTLDGVYNNGHFTGTYSIPPNIDALSQFKVQSHGDQAEFGGVTGGTINIATRSGTNEFHGSAYEFLRNDALDARGFFTARKPALRQNQFGATVGGPVFRNRTFFHASYEGYRRGTLRRRFLHHDTRALRSLLHPHRPCKSQPLSARSFREQPDPGRPPRKDTRS